MFLVLAFFQIKESRRPLSTMPTLDPVKEGHVHCMAINGLLAVQSNFAENATTINFPFYMKRDINPNGVPTFWSSAPWFHV